MSSIKNISGHPEYTTRVHPDALAAINALKDSWENVDTIATIHAKLRDLPFQIQALVTKDILRLLAENWNRYEVLVLEILWWKRDNVNTIDLWQASNDSNFDGDWAAKNNFKQAA